MSQPRHRGKLAKDLERYAAALGYGPPTRTANGHLRFVHRITGRIVVSPSKSGGKPERNAYAELKRVLDPQ